MSSQFSAGASINGYLYQIHILLYELLIRGKEAPDVVAYLERFDDIEFEDENNHYREIAQSKFKGEPGNLTDSSVDLWKSIRIWMTHFEVHPEDEIIYSLITNQSFGKGSISEFLNGDRSLRNVPKAVESLEKVAKESDNAQLKVIFDSFKKFKKEEKNVFVNKIKIITNHLHLNDIESRIKSEFRTTVASKFIEPIYERIEGWWIRIVIRHLQSGGESISALALQLKIQSLVEQFKPDALPIDFDELEAGDIPEEYKTYIFVKQIEWINYHCRIKWALLDYYKAYKQRSKWIREDLILDEDLGKYERRLMEEWERTKDRFFNHLKEKATEDEKILAGQKLFDWMEDAEYHIRDNCKEAYVMRGTFHKLSENKHIYWHPDFFQKLKVLLGDGSI